jgi:hypothetical protein
MCVKKYFGNIIMSDDESLATRYIVVYCKKHNYGKLINLETLQDIYDIEGNLRTLVTCLQICDKGFFKKTSCACELHGVINIKSGELMVERIHGLPHERLYPKGWKLKYYLNSVCTKDVNYGVLKEYVGGGCKIDRMI